MLATLNTRIPLGAGGIPFLPATFSTTIDAIDQIPVQMVNTFNPKYIDSPPPPRPMDLGNFPIEKIVDNDVKQFVDVNNVLPNTSTSTTITPKNNNFLFLLLGGLSLLFIFKNKK
jgi:hypothetical protein